MTAQQGHVYRHGAHRVMAMETSAGTLRVRELDEREPLGIGRAYVVRADWLVPLPMKYFGNAVP